MRIAVLLPLMAVIVSAAAAPVRIVCAEAVWCDIAAQLGGAAVSTEAIVISPRADPHDVTATPRMARAISEADLLVVNGAEYDLWAVTLAEASVGRGNRAMLDVGALASWKPGDNPHLFDDLRVVRIFAERLTANLMQRAPDAHLDLAQRAQAFDKELDGLHARVEALAPQLSKRQVAVTEPIGGALLTALGVRVMDERLALATMHRAEPAPRDVAAVETALSTHAISALIVNPAVSSPATDRLTNLAVRSNIPVIPLTEVPPSGMRWQDWFSSRIDVVSRALALP